MKRMMRPYLFLGITLLSSLVYAGTNSQPTVAMSDEVKSCFVAVMSAAREHGAPVSMALQDMQACARSCASVCEYDKALEATFDALSLLSHNADVSVRVNKKAGRCLRQFLAELGSQGDSGAVTKAVCGNFFDKDCMSSNCGRFGRILACSGSIAGLLSVGALNVVNNLAVGVNAAIANNLAVGGSVAVLGNEAVCGNLVVGGSLTIGAGCVGGAVGTGGTTLAVCAPTGAVPAGTICLGGLQSFAYYYNLSTDASLISTTGVGALNIGVASDAIWNHVGQVRGFSSFVPQTPQNGIRIPNTGVYQITYYVGVSTAAVAESFDVRINGTTVPGSQYSIPAAAGTVTPLTGQLNFAASAGDLLTFHFTGLAAVTLVNPGLVGPSVVESILIAQVA